MRNLTILSALLLLSFSCNTPSDQAAAAEAMTEAEAPVSAEENAINQTIAAVYAGLSFEEGSKPDIEAVLSHFMPEATLYDYSGDTVQFVSVGDYMAGFKAMVDEGQIHSVNVIEGGGETEFFGNIAHRLSVNLDYFDESEEAERGVNSFQLIKVNGKWLINSLIWDVEKEGQPIPEKYLVKK